ncbi:MAG: MurT ligase domain-containing protein [Candidatus Saccharibacteria bacterium]
MYGLRNLLGIAAGRLTAQTMRLLGRQSTALPGYVTERFTSHALRDIAGERKYAAKILVTGTNGKTTTTLLVKMMLEAAGYEVVNNMSGSNLTRGVLTTLLTDKRQGQKTVLLLEVDEASMPAVSEATQPTCIAILNLFRDQLDRYGEVDTTRQLLSQSIVAAPSAELILNADDPHVAALAVNRSNPVQYFGLNLPQLTALAHDHASDVPLSPTTGAPLEYSQRYFGHIGQYAATDKSFQRPKPALQVTSLHHTADKHTEISFTLQKKQHKVTTRLQGVYSVYNVSAATLIAHNFGITLSDIAIALQRKQTAFGRQETVEYRDIAMQFFLIKNPTGFNQVIQAHFQQKQPHPVLIIINDNFADGRDVSWLWDAAIEDAQFGDRLIVSGSRAYDMALRLEYAGISCTVIDEPQAALEEAVRLASKGQVYVLPTYTALLDLRKYLTLKLEHTRE